jgi:hypothetical protein
MSDEPDAWLLRRFAESYQPLSDARFVAEVGARLPTYPVRRALRAAAGAVLGALVTGLTFGIVRPLRARHAGLVALGALGTLGLLAGSVLLSSL